MLFYAPFGKDIQLKLNQLIGEKMERLFAVHIIALRAKNEDFCIIINNSSTDKSISQS